MTSEQDITLEQDMNHFLITVSKFPEFSHK